MAYPKQLWRCGFRLKLCVAANALAVILTFVCSAPVLAQSLSVIHNFAGGQDGSQPVAGMTMDKAGNFYGTASAGGAGYGTVFRLTHKSSAWILSPLYSFTGGNDGAGPVATMVVGPNGTLYGSTAAGGGGACSKIYEYSGCGTLFNLRPAASACKTALCPWTEAVLYRFAGGDDGAYPIGQLLFDQSGDIFGTTADYLQFVSSGTVFELTPSGGGFVKSLAHRFSGSDGQYPASGVIFDQSGNLYGTTYYGGAHGYGAVYQLTPSGSGWTENVLYSFQNGSDGSAVAAGLVFDSVGNLYGAATTGGSAGGGTVFELTPSGGHWTLSVLYSFSGGGGPASSLVMDGLGNLYGTTVSDGANGAGNVFKLTPTGGGWSYTNLYDFTGGNDGGEPFGSLVLDANGNLYGTTEAGGANGDGVVFEIAP
ncbi:MAG: choice-of-anchor tandem repeat GloVer-containing protein [Candidatus Korobacteraceae bacterium]